MKLKEIHLSNFRQFYGEQPIINISCDEKNITIILGENGNGKTGIFRALVFALFGKKYLAQDNLNDEIHLVNMLKLDENPNTPVIASVKVRFSHNDFDCLIERKVTGYKQGNVIDEKIRDGDAILTIFDEFGNQDRILNNSTDIDEFVSSIIDEKIKDFFFFDGEKIETLARTNKSVKEEIKTAIVKLLSIDKIDSAIDILNDIYRKESKLISEKSCNINIQNAQKAKDEVVLNISKHEEKMEMHKTNLIYCTGEISSTKEKLNESKPIFEIQRKIDELEKQKQLMEAALITIKKSLKVTYFPLAHHLLMLDNYGFTNTYLTQQLVNQKDMVPIEVIEKIISEMKCICGCELNTNAFNLENIEKIRQNYSRSTLTPFIGMMNGAISDIILNQTDIRTDICESLKRAKDVSRDIELVKDEIQRLQQEIKGCIKNESNYKSLEEKLEAKVQEENNIKVELKSMESQIVLLEESLRKADRELEKLINADLNLKQDQKKLIYYKRLIQEFENMFSTYSDAMRSELMDTATSIFQLLIDNKDRELVDRIEINSRYEIELHNWNGTKITQDISQGQRQIVALSFITSLAKVAAGSDRVIDFPLFMDTPFGRMSGQNRDNLIKHLPQLASQWVLLLTDTEFSYAEEAVLKATNKLGKWYRLHQEKVGYTRIIEVDINESMASRR